MKHSEETPTPNAEIDLGPHRQRRKGEVVEESDVTQGGIPERIYGGRRTRLTVPVERRKPQGR